MMVPLLFLYGIWYAALRVLRPVFFLGVREYIRQYSLIYQIFSWLKKLWNTFRYEVAHVDFSEKSTKTIWKIVLINFAVLSLCSMMWFFRHRRADRVLHLCVLFYQKNIMTGSAEIIRRCCAV